MQLVVDATAAREGGVFDRFSYEAEPSCWRQFAGAGARLTLKPDMYAVVDAGEYRLRWFVEIDRATESLPVIVRKARIFARYYQTGKEQATGDGTFPRVLWVAPDEQRASAIRRAIGRENDLPQRLFLTTTSEQAVAVMAGGTP